MRKVTLTYFRTSGDFVSSAHYFSTSWWDYQVINEVREMVKTNTLPDMDSWEGIILIEPKAGFPYLLYTKNDSSTN